MTGDRTSALLARLSSIQPDMPYEPAPCGRVVACDGQLVEAVGLGARIGAISTIDLGTRPLEAEIVGFREGRAMLMAFGGTAALGPGARATLDGNADWIRVGEGLLGAVVDARGVPLDGRRTGGRTGLWPLRGSSVRIGERAGVAAPVASGVRAIDALLTMGRGQRIGIVAGSGVGKSVLLGMLTRGVEADVVVVALIGERGREVADFVSRQLDPAARRRTVVVAAPADQSPALRLRGAETATAIAEYFRSEGKSVLLIVDSLTRVAHARREIGIALGEPTSARGYPPSALALIPALCERAGAIRGGGSITAIYTVLADGDDTESDPVVDAARAILDGHVVLSRRLAERGHFPAIDIGRSVSRVMHDIAAGQHLAAARRVRRLLSAYEENRDLVLLGAYDRGSDSVLDEALVKMPAIEAFLQQEIDEIAAFDTAIAGLCAL